jgi:NADH-quinone oxidoreductase subunit F
VIEAMTIAGYATGAHEGYIYVRGEYRLAYQRLENAIQQAEQRGLLGQQIFGQDFDFHIHPHAGAGAYICGEETALLESLEGKLGQPRLRPPFPAAEGLFAKPTVVNNVETLTNLPPIITRGADWYRTIGTEKSPGPKVFSLSGHVERPGNYELPLGSTFRELIYEHGGGIRGGRRIKGIMPAGASAPLLAATDEVLDTPMDYESVPAIGSQLGSASIIVMDESVDISWMVYKTSSFFKHESCGKCTPCREGTYWMYHVTKRIQEGNASPEDIELLDSVARGIQGKCLCALGEFALMPVISGIEHFRADFQTHTGDRT